MNFRRRHAAYSFVGISIAITILLAFPEVNRSGAKARPAAPTTRLRAATTVVGGGSATLYPANLNTWTHINQWHGSLCSGDFVVGFSPEEVVGTVVAGYTHTYDKGKPVLGCPSGNNSVHRGTVWFDLSDIISKAPPLHVSATTATLHFKRLSGSCSGELLYATADWMKGYTDGDLVPGESFSKESPFGPPLATFGSCGTAGCSINVVTVVNNWLKGPEHGGYANYGFVFKGMAEADAEYSDNDSCLARFGDFSLTVDYKYEEERVKSVPQTYPLECRGTDALKIMDFDGPVPFRWVGFNFIRGTGPAGKGLLPGQCSWLDRGMRPGEPARLAQPIENTQVWNKELNSPDSYWTFNVYNAGDQLQATGAERSKKFFVPLLRTNVALAANKGVASASSFTPDTEIPGYEFQPSSANDGNISGSTYPHNAFWRDGTDNVWPDWLRIDFDGSKKISEIDVYGVQDTIDTTGPTDKGVEGLFSTINGIVDFELQYLDGSVWQPIPGTMVKGNTKVLNKFTLKPAITTTAIRVNVTAALNKRSRIVELEAWGN